MTIRTGQVSARVPRRRSFTAAVARPGGRSRHAQGSRRGYTLVELAVVVVLSTLLVFGMARWLVGIAYSSKVGFQAASDRAQFLALEQFTRDVHGVRWCRADGADARVREMDADSVMLVVGDATLGDVLVAWRLDAGSLQRGEVTLDADCEASPANWVTWVEGVDRFELASVKGGAALSAGTSGPCPHEWFERCQVDALQVTISLEDDPSETSLVLYVP